MCSVHQATTRLFPALSLYYRAALTNAALLARIQPQETLGEINILHREAHLFAQTGVLAQDLDEVIALIACKCVLLQAKGLSLRFNQQSDDYEFAPQESEDA